MWVDTENRLRIAWTGCCDSGWRGIARAQGKRRRAPTARPREGGRSSERIKSRLNLGSQLRSSQVVENTKSSANHRLPVAILKELVGHPDSRAQVPQWSLIQRCTRWCQSQVR